MRAPWVCRFRSSFLRRSPWPPRSFSRAPASYLLQAILVAILGGVSPNGGAGSVLGVVLALLSLQFISSGFSALRLSQFTQEFAWGALLLVVMVLHVLAHHHRRR
jgi:simple sugar transport system permease protein